MTQKIKPWLFWAPRILGILFAIFISLFALDVFGNGAGFWETLIGLLIHLVPTYLVVISLLIAWRWERLGAALFLALGGAYLMDAWGRFDWTAYAAISGPLFLIGILFMTDWLYNKFSSPQPPPVST